MKLMHGHLIITTMKQRDELANSVITARSPMIRKQVRRYYDTRLSHDENHKCAAAQLARQEGVRGTLCRFVGNLTPTGYYFFVDGDAPDTVTQEV